jgi:hydroxyacylglutathione hydrolase
MKQKEFIRRLRAQQPPTLLDVRTGFEFKRGHIPGALHAPTWKILLRLAKLPADKKTELVVTCELGPRAQIARSLLNALGYTNVVLLEGQMAGWRQSGGALETGSAKGCAPLKS